MNTNHEKKQKIVQLPMFVDIADGETPLQLPKYTQQVKLWVELAQKTNDPAGYIAGILEQAGIRSKSIGSKSIGSNESQGTSIGENENSGKTETETETESRGPRQLIFNDDGMPYYRTTRRITVNHKAAYAGNLEQFKKAYELFKAKTKTPEIIRQLNARPATVYRWVKRFRECGSG